MRVDTYWDIPELLDYPLPFTAEELILQEDIDLQDGFQEMSSVGEKAKNVIWQAYKENAETEGDNLYVGVIKNKKFSHLLTEWAKDIFPEDFFSHKFHMMAHKIFPATLIMTKASKTSFWHYEGFYPWSNYQSYPGAELEQLLGHKRTGCTLNIKLKADNDSDLVFGRPNDRIMNEVERLYINRRNAQDVQWNKDMNIRTNMYSDALMFHNEEVVEIDRKVNYDSPFLLNLGHLDTHPNPWHRVENSRTSEPRITFRLMLNEEYPMKHWIDMHNEGKLLNAKS